MTKIVLILIEFYQALPLPNSCRFIPSCSEYTYQAIIKYGLIEGVLRGLWRILRCHPFNEGGIDPV